MGDRQAQEFWDQMWYWERYESYPNEDIDDPHLVIILGSQVDAASSSGQQPDPKLFARFDACVGRVLNRLTDVFPTSVVDIDLAEVKHWLEFGLNPSHRGHDGVQTPIIDANSLVIFLQFTRYAREYCQRHGLEDLKQTWIDIEKAAQEVEESTRRRGEPRRASRFEPQ